MTALRWPSTSWLRKPPSNACNRLTTALTEAAKGWRFEPVVAALRALRGIDTVCAVGLVTEIGDISRSGTARS